jgi:acetoin utilization protein AcuC
VIGIATHHPVDPATRVPEEWQEEVVRRYGRRGPEHMTDGESAAFRPWAAGYDPSDDVDRAIRATRAAVFPLLGLDPEHD